MKTEHVGITATRKGLTATQLKILRASLQDMQSWEGARVFHHGDCLGGDVEGAAIARELGYRIVAHPPANPKLRAYDKADEIREPLSYVVRNRNIVDETATLFACPDGPERQHSGTWLTVRYARKVGARYQVIGPVGGLYEERAGWDGYQAGTYQLPSPAPAQFRTEERDQ
jgi:hypothetical protein